MNQPNQTSVLRRFRRTEYQRLLAPVERQAIDCRRSVGWSRQSHSTVRRRLLVLNQLGRRCCYHVLSLRDFHLHILPVSLPCGLVIARLQLGGTYLRGRRQREFPFILVLGKAAY